MKNPAPNQSFNTIFPPGYRFHPTEAELVTYYLSRKICNIPFPVDLIPQIGLYDHAPWQLPALSTFNSTEKIWFFFNLVSSIGWPIGNGKKVSRATPEGQWKSEGNKRAIVVDRKIVGWKKKMTFYAGTVGDRKRTDWNMTEYRRTEDDYVKPQGDLLVISEVYVKIMPAQLQMLPHAMHRIIANDGHDSAQEKVLDMTLDREASLDGKQDLYSKKLEQVSTMAIPKVGRSILNNESLSSKSVTSSGCLSLPGFRFHPTDYELIEYYLMRKVLNLPIHDDAISDIDLYNCVPWQLPSQSRLKHRNMEWYFFNFYDQKYTHRHSYFNLNCKAVKGYWLPSGTDMPVRKTSTNPVIGMKKILNFHWGEFPYGRRTDWIMLEYRLKDEDQIGSLCVVSKIWKMSTSFTHKQLTASKTYGNEVVAPVNESTCTVVSDLDAAKRENVLHSSTNTEQDMPIESQKKGELNAIRSYTIDPIHECNSKVHVSKMIPLNGHGKPDFCTRKGTRTFFMVGSEVEVAYIHENVPVAWYTASVTEIISENVLLVEYLSLPKEDGSLLRETVSTQNIRPRSPSTLEVRNFQLLDMVEAFCNGGWWQGVVAAVKDRCMYNVKLMHLEDEIEFNNTELRALYDWIDEEWILASQDKSLESQNNAESLHAYSPLHKRKDPDPVATSTSNVNISVLLPSFKQNKNNQESRSPFLGSKKGRTYETAEDNTKLSGSRGAGTSSNALKLGPEVPTLICEEQRLNIHVNTMVEKTNKDCQQTGKPPEIDQDGVQDEQQNNVKSLHGCNYVPKCKDYDRLATSMNNINIPCLLLLLPQNKNNEELTRPFTRSMRIVNIWGNFMSLIKTKLRINLWNQKTMLNT